MRKRVLVSLICIAMVVANLASTGFQVQASELKEDSNMKETQEFDSEASEEENDNSTDEESADEKDSEDSEEQVGETGEENPTKSESEIEGEQKEENDCNEEVLTEENGETEDLESDFELATAADDIASGIDGNISWVIDADGKLTVNGTGDFSDAESVYAGRLPWNSYRESIVSAEVEIKGMKNASFMFAGCKNMKSVNLNNFDTSNVANMQEMFSGCNSLVNLDLSNFNTINVTNMYHIFYGCTNLSNLNLSSFDTDKITDMSSMFSGCSSLKNLDLSSFKTNNVTNMALMFLDCDSLVSLDLSNFDTSNVIQMYEMFENCSSLEQLNLSNFNTGNVKSMDRMFQGCSSLIGLNLSNFNTSSVTDMADMFNGCSSLISLDLSNFNTDNVKYMYRMFEKCSNLTYLDLRSFNTGKITEMYEMFRECSKLEKLDLGSFNTENVTDMSFMFWNCSSLNDLNLSSFDTRNVTSMAFMFDNCCSLTELNLENFNTSNVTNMNNMFDSCKSLTEINLNNFNTSKVTGMGAMFSGCSSLAELDLGNFITSNVTDMQYMFSFCSGLKNLNISSFDVSNVEKIYSMFIGCSNLSRIQTPCNLTQSITLPTAKSTDVWYLADGTTITELPQNLNYSVMIEKNKKPAASYISVSKTKTTYSSGDAINTDDITVTYYDQKGIATKVTDFTTNVSEIDMSTPGKKQLIVTYQGMTAVIELSVTYVFTDSNVSVILAETNYIYNGIAKEPVPNAVTLTDNGTILKEGTDYSVSYKDNTNAGTAKVIITGQNDYSGTVSKSFVIGRANLKITASDMVLAVGDSLPKSSEYEYQIEGLVSGDKLITKPLFTCDVSDMTKTGTYTITPYGADAGANYQITYYKGKLTVAEERVFYTVTFEMLGHGAAVESIDGVKAGNLVTEPETPQAEGYVFAGWYKDRACTKTWNFETDTVQENTTLYACWLMKNADTEETDTELYLQDIQEQAYTGNALKPSVLVCSGEENTPLKAGKDYTIKYFNNVAADTEEESSLGGISKNGEEGDNGFTKELAYVVITGKGNYTGTIYRNFHISATSIADSNGNEVSGVAVKYTEQMSSNSKKAQKPLNSLKYKYTLKAGTDYDVILTALKAYDKDDRALTAGITVDEGSTVEIPAGYCGTFQMQIVGKGNYSGTIVKTIYVSDKTHLMKNVTITLGKNLKNIAYTGEEITLTPAETNGSDVFTVKSGKVNLKYGRDYTVSYINNRAVGTATMILTGVGDYVGSKSISFRITGAGFNAKNINVGNFQTSIAYTGKAITQNTVVLTDKDGTELVYGKHYTISYRNNINKGTASMTFTAKAASGYSGSFTKNFKIVPAELVNMVNIGAVDSSLDNISIYDNIIKFNGIVSYTREGVKPINRICLTNKTTGAVLKEGTDFTVSYADNMSVTTDSSKMPVMTIKGKGNYAGSLNVNFTITKASLEGNNNLKVTATAIAFNTKKADTYEYKPRVKVTDGKKTLAVNKDYDISYENCTQAAVQSYLDALRTGMVNEQTPRPYVKIAAKDGSGYTGKISVELTIYDTKLTSSNLYIMVSPEDTVYTGRQVKPKVAVYYGDAKSVKAAKKANETDEVILTDKSGEYGLTRLNLKTAENETGDYSLTYGTNVAAGKNKGSVTVTGTGLYGGSVTVKFTVQSRNVYAD